MQPAYLPWLGYFDRLLKSDLHVILDHVSMDKNSKTKFTNRNKIRTPEGWSWVTVPVWSSRRETELPINRLEVNSEISWANKHWRTLQANYSRAPYFKNHAPFFEDLYQRDWLLIAPLLQESTNYLLKELGIQTEILRSSELSPKEKKADLILELCKRVGATTYLSGPFGRDYLNEGAFDAAGIELQFHDYNHPEYKQAFSGFELYMSVIDLLFNHGGASLDILRT